MDNEKTLYITLDDGSEAAMEIVFTFDSPDGEKEYVLFRDPKDEEGQVWAMIYDEGNLYEIETDEEWEMVEEMLALYNDGELEKD
ncbi:MAG: DUF1292 domain-containing protein [Erysipelotrichaceae bacterium]|nr:DUF1292 domain-containing protein [Erysipelotrichaceae bacterium]